MIRVKVIDSNTGLPVVGALVSLKNGKALLGITGAEGAIAFKVSPGLYCIRVTRRGYTALREWINVDNRLFQLSLVPADPLLSRATKIESVKIADWDDHFMAVDDVTGIGKGEQKIIIHIRPGKAIPAFIPSAIEDVPVEVRFDEFFLIGGPDANCSSKARGSSVETLIR